MKHFKNEKKKDLLINPATPTTRIFSAIVDIVISSILGILIFSFAAQPIIGVLPNAKEVKNNMNEINEKLKEYYESTGLAIFDEEKSTYDTESQILEHTENKLEEKEDLIDNKYSDIFVEFYINIAPKLFFDDKNVEIPYKTIQEINSKYLEANTDEIKIYQDTNDGTNLVHFTSEAKLKISNYINKDKKEITSEDEKYYKVYDNQIHAMLEEAIELINSSSYFDKLSKDMQQNGNVFLLHHTVASFLVYIITFALYFVLIPCLFKDGQTLGKFFLKINVFSENKEFCSKRNLLARSCLSFISYSFLISVFPFLSIGMSALALPVLIINGKAIGITIPLMVVFIFNIISFAFMMFTKLGQTLVDKASRTVVGSLFDELNEVSNEEIVEDKTGEIVKLKEDEPNK